MFSQQDSVLNVALCSPSSSYFFFPSSAVALLKNCVYEARKASDYADIQATLKRIIKSIRWLQLIVAIVSEQFKSEADIR